MHGAMPSEGNYPKYPEIRIASEKLKSVKDWEVGKQYKILVSVKQISKETLEKGGILAGFEILGFKDMTEERGEVERLNRKLK